MCFLRGEYDVQMDWKLSSLFESHIPSVQQFGWIYNRGVRIICGMSSGLIHLKWILPLRKAYGASSTLSGVVTYLDWGYKKLHHFLASMELQLEIFGFFCFCFCFFLWSNTLTVFVPMCVISRNPNTPSWSSMADNAITCGCNNRRSSISCLNLWK